ncbi:MAG: murein biosynthesis integral membrane protein MurJ [Nitriliruptoraceae bacterium]
MASDATGGGTVDGGLRSGSRAVAAAILLSRLAGLVRERVIAQWLGTGFGAEAVRAALRIPNLLQNLLGDGVLSAAFVPSYARLVAEGREEEAGRLAAAVAAVLLAVTAVLATLGVLFAEPLTRVLAPGFPPGTAKFDLTVQLVRVLAPGAGVLVLSAWALGVLTAHRRFFRAYVAPVLWNAAIVTAGVAAGLRGLAEADVARAVAVGALVGAVLQLAVQLPAVRRHGGPLALRPVRPRASAALPAVLRAARGAIASRGVVQLSAYLDLAVASLLAAGAVAALGYAQVLHLLPVSLFGMSVAAAALPDLATTGRAAPAVAAARVRSSLRRTTAFALPTAVAYVVVGEHVVALLFGGGAFGPAETRQVAAVLAAYALGLAATTQGRVLQSTLHALDDTRTPARVAGLRVLVGTAVGVGLMLVLDAWRLDAGGPTLAGAIGPASAAERGAEASLLRLGAVGLALGASLGAWVEVRLLRRAVAARIPLRAEPVGWSGPLLVALAVAATALAARSLPAALGLSGPAAALAVLVPVGVAGAVALRLAGELGGTGRAGGS